MPPQRQLPTGLIHKAALHLGPSLHSCRILGLPSLLPPSGRWLDLVLECAGLEQDCLDLILVQTLASYVALSK